MKNVASCKFLLFLTVFSFFSSYLCQAGESADANIRFGIVTDSHYADTDAKGTRFYRESVAKMAECVDKMNQEKVSFLIELGDFMDQGNPASEEKTFSFLRTIESEFAKFAGPRYHALGNHDQDSISKKSFLENIENTGVPNDKNYYSFIKKGIQFIVLDANFKKDGTSYDHGNFDWTDANVPQEELNWLKKTLSDHDGKSIVFIHQRLDAETAECVRNSPEIRKILSDSGKVLAVFNGHDHGGGLRKIDGIFYYTLKAMIEKSGVENNSYAIVQVNKDFTLKIAGFRRAESAELK